jgi:putative membrane protein
MKNVMAAAAVVLLAGCAMQSSHTDGATHYSLMTEPSAFASEAAVDRAGQVAMAKVALQRAKSKDVQDFSQQLLASDAADDQQLGALAQQSGVTFPGQVSQSDQYRIDALGRVAHGEFDRIYMDTMVDSLGHSTRLYTAGAKASTPAVASYASQALPMVTDQLEQSERVDVLAGGGLGPVSGNN